MQIHFPESRWSTSVLGFTAPTYTTIFFVIGIGIIGRKSFFKIPYFSIIYYSISVLFVIFYTVHSYNVYSFI